MVFITIFKVVFLLFIRVFLPLGAVLWYKARASFVIVFLLRNFELNLSSHIYRHAVLGAVF